MDGVERSGWVGDVFFFFFLLFCFFFFKQKTAYEIKECDWSSDVCSSDLNVKPAKNSRDRLIDFSIDGASFDHKTSVFPKNYNLPIDEAIRNTPELIKWFYKNQSQQQRKHLKNRLFIVLYSGDGKHWKLKAEISWLQKIIDHYMIGFNPHFLMKFSFEKDKEIISDIIWAVKKKLPNLRGFHG